MGRQKINGLVLWPRGFDQGDHSRGQFRKPVCRPEDPNAPGKGGPADRRDGQSPLDRCRLFLLWENMAYLIAKVNREAKDENFQKDKIGFVDGEGAFILDQARGRTTQPPAHSSKGRKKQT
jgi:hypothetical protein